MHRRAAAKFRRASDEGRREEGADVRRLPLANAAVAPSHCWPAERGDIPADQCDVYRVLVDAGRSVGEIADIYGVAEQETVWFESSAWDRDAHTLRRRLTHDEHSFLDNRIAQFVGLDAFEAAGGVVRRDLFSDQGAAWYTDQALMERTALAMLEDAVESIRTAGWAVGRTGVDARLQRTHAVRRRSSDRTSADRRAAGRNDCDHGAKLDAITDQ